MSEIYRDDALVITQEQGNYYIETFKKGISPDSVYKLVKQFPGFEITRFNAMHKALLNAPYGPELFGIKKDQITVQVSQDMLEAYITLNVPAQKLDRVYRDQLFAEVMDALKDADITYGILPDTLKGDLPLNRPLLIARGMAPVHGKDAEVKYYKIDDPQPTIVDHGKVNYYDLNLIHKVRTGDWLGERTDPVPGTPGKNVYGVEIEPECGELVPLHYDRNSVELVREDGKDVLYALKTGAVYNIDNNIAVYDVLEIDGDVDFNSGNIDFSGYVFIKGSVEENFSVRSGKDIEILGEYGIGGVDTIESVDGNIYIRGGVAGKNRAKIKCKKNLYVKYLSDVEVICEGSVYVGFYIRNSKIRAKQVIVDSSRGQIVGGLIDTDIRVECADIGNRMETRTWVTVRGFNRDELQGRVEEIVGIVREKKEQLIKLKRMMKGTDRKKNDASIMQKTRFALLQVQAEIKSLEAERLSVQNFMKTPGEGAVIVKRRIYPKVRIEIQGEALEIGEEALASVFIVRDGRVQPI